MFPEKKVPVSFFWNLEFLYGPYVLNLKHRDSPYMVHFKHRDSPYVYLNPKEIAISYGILRTMSLVGVPFVLVSPKFSHLPSLFQLLYHSTSSTITHVTQIQQILLT